MAWCQLWIELGFRRRRTRLLRRARRRGLDGRVSIEVDPRNAHDTEATVAQAWQLWRLVDRPNLFVKIPAAKQGLPAISACLAEGISINVTLIFSLARYDEVRDAFLTAWSMPATPAATLPRSGRSRRFSCPGWTPKSTPAWIRWGCRRLPRCAARQRSPTPGWPTSTTSGC